MGLAHDSAAQLSRSSNRSLPYWTLGMHAPSLHSMSVQAFKGGHGELLLSHQTHVLSAEQLNIISPLFSSTNQLYHIQRPAHSLSYIRLTETTNQYIFTLKTTDTVFVETMTTLNIQRDSYPKAKLYKSTNSN
jgi:hypothetical protein